MKYSSVIMYQNQIEPLHTDSARWNTVDNVINFVVKVTLLYPGPLHGFYKTPSYSVLIRIKQYQTCAGHTYACLKYVHTIIIWRLYPEINTGCFIKSVQGGWVQDCYLDNKINDIINCILSCTICVQWFIWIWQIITEL